MRGQSVEHIAQICAGRAGRFRGDPYYRLKVIALRIPPLRKRPGNAPPLAGDGVELCALPEELLVSRGQSE